MRKTSLSFKRPEADLSTLELLALDFPNVDAAIAEVARLAAVQTLPKGAVHVISMSNYSLRLATRVFPAEYSELLLEMLHAPSTERGPEFFEALIDELVRRGRALHLIHLPGRLIRNLAVDELIIGGDCWDRGPRADRVVDYIRLQPNVAFISFGTCGVDHDPRCLARIALRHSNATSSPTGSHIVKPRTRISRCCTRRSFATRY